MQRRCLEVRNSTYLRTWFSPATFAVPTGIFGYSHNVVYRWTTINPWPPSILVYEVRVGKSQSLGLKRAFPKFPPHFDICCGLKHWTKTMVLPHKILNLGKSVWFWDENMNWTTDCDSLLTENILTWINEMAYSPMVSRFRVIIFSVHRIQ